MGCRQDWMHGAIDAAGAEKDLWETNLNDEEVLEDMQRDMEAAHCFPIQLWVLASRRKTAALFQPCPRASISSLMTDTDLLKNTRNTRNITGMGWRFSLCAADEGDSDSEMEAASAGSHSSLVPSPDLPVSEELRLVRDLDLGARQDPAIFKSNPWTIAKLRAATRKPLPSITHCTGPSVLTPAPHQVLASTPTSKARSILDPQLKNRIHPQHTLCGKKPPRQQKRLSPPRTKRGLDPPAMRLNPYTLPGLPPICLDPPATRKSDKFAEATLTQPRTSPVENCTSREQEGIQTSSLGTPSKGPPFSSPCETTPMFR